MVAYQIKLHDFLNWNQILMYGQVEVAKEVNYSHPTTIIHIRNRLVCLGISVIHVKW